MCDCIVDSNDSGTTYKVAAMKTREYMAWSIGGFIQIAFIIGAVVSSILGMDTLRIILLLAIFIWVIPWAFIMVMSAKSNNSEDKVKSDDY